MSMNSLQKIIRILTKEPKERNVVDKKMLFDLTKDIAFFLQYQDNAYVHESLCSYMTYETYEEKEPVFEINSIGDKFYIILEGSVGVYIYNESQEMICVKKLMKGSSFGELALLYETPRMATIICQEKSHFAVLQKKEFLRVLKNEQKEKLNRKLLYLQSLPIFQKINQQLLRLIYSKAFDISTTKGQIIFKQGQPTQNFYIVKSGEFSVKQEIQDHTDQEQIQSIYSISHKDLFEVQNQNRQKRLPIKLSLLVSGDYFGEEDILQQNEKRCYTVQCVTAVGEILMIQKNLFMQILNEFHPSLFLKQNLEIKMEQYKERINNSKRQIKKFKSYLIEDRASLKVKKQIEEEQNNFQKINISSRYTRKEQTTSSQRNINIDISNNNEEKQPPVERQKKKSITFCAIDEQSQKILNEKIQKLISLKGLHNLKKPKIPTQEEIKLHNQMYGVNSSLNGKSSPYRTDQSPSNERSSQSNNSSIATPSEEGTPSRKKTYNKQSSFIKLLSQKMPYKQSIFNDNYFLDKDNQLSQSNDNLQLPQANQFYGNTNEQPQGPSYIIDVEDPTSLTNIKSSTFNRKAMSTKNLASQKISFANLSSNNIDHSDNTEPTALNLRNFKDYNQGRKVIETSRTSRTVNSQHVDLNSPQSPFAQTLLKGQTILEKRKMVSFSQNHSSNQAQNISSSNDPDKINSRQQLKRLFEDDNRFVSDFFNKRQAKQLVNSVKSEESQIHSERSQIKKQLIKSKSKKDNYIDHSSDNQKRYLIDQVNILTSPRQKQFVTEQSQQSITTTIFPRQNSQPTLRYIDLQKQDISECQIKMTQNQLVNGSLADFSKKYNSQVMKSANNLSGKQFIQTNSSLLFKLDFGVNKTANFNHLQGNYQLQNSYQLPNNNSQKNIFQQHATTQHSGITNNIHIRKDPTASKHLKMNIRFQNLFKNH